MRKELLMQFAESRNDGVQENSVTGSSPELANTDGRDHEMGNTSTGGRYNAPKGVGSFKASTLRLG